MKYKITRLSEPLQYKSGKWLFAMIAFLILHSFSYAQIPREVGFVNDFAQLLSPEARNRINDWAIELREKTEADFFIAIFPEIGGSNEADYGVKVYQQWKIGSKRDEGALIMLALAERKLRIEVGYGAEGYITDAFANEVYQVMRGYLKSGSEDWDAAFTQGSLMILQKFAEEKGVTLTGMSEYSKGSVRTSKRSGMGGIGLIVLFIFLMIVTKGRILEVLIWMSILGGRGGGNWGGGNNDGWGGGSSGGFGGFGGFGGGGGGRSGGGGAGGGF
ncbi:MAG: TPM domain-containing protein [Candidatus Cloacimonetes bacterium]|nr:TPM domain-containing protein [Candidatus Cloacimonadota bacterium]